jgi:hypothetical protein
MKAPKTDLESLAERVRKLSSERRYREAQACFESYCRLLEQTLVTLAPRDPCRRELELAWRELLSDTHRRVLIGRAHAAARLARLPKPSPFAACSPAAPRTWELLG